ncbi:MAG: hypothetical protein JO151_13585 [Verrucomicrobia bacterium]|nr:hypothetical protein [Verrucomicrobiota bacterium]
MTAENYGNEPSQTRSGPETNDQPQRWRIERGLSAKPLGELDLMTVMCRTRGHIENSGKFKESGQGRPYKEQNQESDD